MAKTKIEWSEMSWNPVVGCSKVSEGCKNCYAERMAQRFNRNPMLLKPSYGIGGKLLPDYCSQGYNFNWKGLIALRTDRLDQPLHWRKPRRIFVCSMSDLFHPAVPFEFIDKVLGTAYLCPQHTFQILTKRPMRALEYFDYVSVLMQAKVPHRDWPLKNVWLGVSVENQRMLHRYYEEYSPGRGRFCDIPAAKLFVSFEPLLTPITTYFDVTLYRKPDWVIIGCESGPKRRECKLKWVRDIVQQCKGADVPVFVKQLSINGKVSHNPAEWPEDLRLRQTPQ